MRIVRLVVWTTHYVAGCFRLMSECLGERGECGTQLHEAIELDVDKFKCCERVWSA